MRQCVRGCVFFNCLDSNFGGAAVGETELARRDAAEGDAAATVLNGQPDAVAVALRQLQFLLYGGNAGGHDRPNGVYHILGGQVVALCDDGPAGGNLAATQYVVALLPQLQPRRRVDGVVDAGM